MKKIFAIVLATSMVLSLCACSSNTDTSSNNEDVIVEEVIIDQTSSEENTTVESNQDTTASENNSSTQTPNTSSSAPTTSNIESPIKKYQNMYVEVDLCDDIIRGYLDANTTRQQYYWLSTYSYGDTNSITYDHQTIYLDWYLGYGRYGTFR